MNDARFWIALSAVVFFLAGTATGVLYARQRDPEPAGGWAAYAARLGAEFDLSPERRAHLRMLLDGYASELAYKRRAYEARIQSQLEPELRELATRFDGYIRDYVLPPDERARFDQRSLPLDVVAAH
ncbi:MAG: hypothetical protein R3F49_21085 [Planctomycetota bacterium]